MTYQLNEEDFKQMQSLRCLPYEHTTEDPNRLKILVCHPNYGGCAYYRALMPFAKLSHVCKDKVEVRFDSNPLGRKKDGSAWIENWDFENIKWADIVVVSNISNFGGPYTARIVGKSKEFGKFVHFDTDDLLTNLYQDHKLADVYNKQGLGDIAKFCYYNADLVTVTQRKFAERVKQYCRGVLAIVKNCIDYDLPGWRFEKKSDPRVRVGWAGGIHHLPDVKVFSAVPHIVNQKVGRENLHWRFYGYPPPDPNQKKDWQHETWDHYKKTLLNGFKGEKNWDIFYALPPSDYGIYFSEMDIAVAPLQMNEFNDSKSDIKVAEAGRYKIPIIASNVGCYDETIINGKTGYLIDPDAPRSEWIRLLTKVAKDHKHRQELGENLHAVTSNLFDANKVVEQRFNMYEECFKIYNKDPRNRVQA